MCCKGEKKGTNFPGEKKVNLTEMRRKAMLTVLFLLLMVYCYVHLGMITVNVDQIIRDSLNRQYQYPFTDIRYLNRTNWRIYNCQAIIEGDEEEMKRTEDLKWTMNTDEDVIQASKNCFVFLKAYEDNFMFNTPEEEKFPIAFNILLYKEVAQVELLLRAIYRPQNTYCLHVDGRSPQHVHNAARSLASCFQNVFIVSKTEHIVYRSFQRLQADINCMKDHVARPEPWKYLINLPSQEFPLKTNAEMVKILKAYNNSNDIEGILGKRRLMERVTKVYKNVFKKDGTYKVVQTSKSNPKPPHDMAIVKGSAYGVFTRKFVDYVINNQTAKDLLDWCRGVLSPDEYYWAMLNHNPHLRVPGSYKGKADEKPWFAAYAAWHGVDKCGGKWMRSVCVFGVRDLARLANRKELFANKFVQEYQPLTLQCLFELNRHKTISQLPFNSSFYKQLPFVNNHF